MQKLDNHPMYLVRQSIGGLMDAYLQSYRTKPEDNQITEEERSIINAHIESLNALFDTFQKRIKNHE